MNKKNRRAFINHIMKKQERLNKPGMSRFTSTLLIGGQEGQTRNTRNKNVIKHNFTLYIKKQI